jgi:hypothetical protein
MAEIEAQRAPDADSDNEIDVIYHNMNVGSNFRTYRTQRSGTIKGQMQRLNQQIENGCFDQLISVAASKHSFVVVVATTLSKEELSVRGFPQ